MTFRPHQWDKRNLTKLNNQPCLKMSTRFILDRTLTPVFPLREKVRLADIPLSRINRWNFHTFIKWLQITRADIHHIPYPLSVLYLRSTSCCATSENMYGHKWNMGQANIDCLRWQVSLNIVLVRHSLLVHRQFRMFMELARDMRFALLNAILLARIATRAKTSIEGSYFPWLETG